MDNNNNDYKNYDNMFKSYSIDNSTQEISLLKVNICLRKFSLDRLRQQSREATTITIMIMKSRITNLKLLKLNQLTYDYQ